MSFRFFQIVFVSFFGFLFFISAGLGFLHGKQGSDTSAILSNAKAMDEAIGNFFDDQDRYPSLEELVDPNVFGSYVSAFPISDIKVGGCSTNFEYKNPNPYSYELYVCLPRAAQGLSAGWNVYNNKVAE